MVCILWLISNVSILNTLTPQWLPGLFEVLKLDESPMSFDNLLDGQFYAVLPQCPFGFYPLPLKRMSEERLILLQLVV